MWETRTIKAGDVGSVNGKLVQVVTVLLGGRLLVCRDDSQWKIARDDLKEAWRAEEYPDPAEEG